MCQEQKRALSLARKEHCDTLLSILSTQHARALASHSASRVQEPKRASWFTSPCEMIHRAKTWRISQGRGCATPPSPLPWQGTWALPPPPLPNLDLTPSPRVPCSLRTQSGPCFSPPGVQIALTNPQAPPPLLCGMCSACSGAARRRSRELPGGPYPAYFGSGRAPQQTNCCVAFCSLTRRLGA